MKFVFLVFALSMCSISFADVNVIQSAIVGKAYKVGDVVNVVDPKIQMSNSTDLLCGGSGKKACEMLDMEFVSEDTDSSGFGFQECILLDDNGSFQFVKKGLIAVLSCKK